MMEAEILPLKVSLFRGLGEIKDRMRDSNIISAIFYPKGPPSIFTAGHTFLMQLGQVRVDLLTSDAVPDMFRLLTFSGQVPAFPTALPAGSST